jgi:excisionase family DNA binding protein
MSNPGKETRAEAILLTAKQVAEALQVSTRTLWRMLATGQLIEPLKIGRSVRWRKQELLDWIAKGCPQRSKSIEKGL